jgi:DNA helicase-2/ATP-dependent DNA helicase PcrA
LWTVGENVLPLAFRTVGNRIDAALNLLLDEVTRTKLGRKSFGRQSALVHLGLPEEGIEQILLEHFRPILTELVAGLPAVDALEQVRDAAEAVSPKSRPTKLKASAEEQRVQEVERLRRRLTRADLIPGLTVHQAKGCEWPRVGVALTAAHETALATGLTNAQEEHCVVYVALTRAKELCGSLAHEDELGFGGDD